MTITRRSILAAAIAAPAVIRSGGLVHAATKLKISHQFPGSSGTEGDFRDRLCRMFATEVEKRTKGSLAFDIYAGSSLMKVNAQFSAVRKGALDMGLIPLPYAGGELPETNIGLMPCLVTSYAQAAAWKQAPVGRELDAFLIDKGVVIVSWVWQAGGAATRDKAMIGPEDAKGLKLRGGSREMDLVLQKAGAAVLSLPSNELYAAMQTGACDGGITSSTSLISFRLEELSKHLTTGRGKSYWFMLEPLVMSRAIFDKLTKEEQSVVMTVGAELEAFGRQAAMADDELVAKVFDKAGAKVHDLDAATVGRWAEIARETAWADYAGKTATSKRLIELAQQVAV